MGDPLATGVWELLEGDWRASHYRGTHALAHLLVGESGDRHVAYRRMRPDGLLDLDRPELLSSAIDGVLQPAARVDVAVGILAGEVPGGQPAFDDVLGGDHPQPADRPGLDIDSGLGVYHPDLNTRERQAD